MKKYITYASCLIMQIPVFFTPLYFIGILGSVIILGLIIASLANDLKN